MAQLLRDDGSVVAGDVRLATSTWQRFVGLMGRPSIGADEGLYIRPCNSIHMFFMRFPIDAVFVDKDGAVLRIYTALRPWRMTRLVRKAKACIELASGVATARGVQVGDRLVLRQVAS